MWTRSSVVSALGLEDFNLTNSRNIVDFVMLLIVHRYSI